MTVAVGDVVRVTAVLDHSLEGKVMNVWWATQYSNECSDTEFIQAAKGRLETVYSYLVNLMPDTVAFDEIRFYNISQSRPMDTTGWPTFTTGTVDVADPLPSVLSGLVFGRSGFPRVLFKKYFGPFTEANQVDAEWDSAIVTNISLGVTLWMGGWTSGPGLCKGGLFSETLLTWYDIGELVVRSVPSYQRKRKRGVGV